MTKFKSFIKIGVALVCTLFIGNALPAMSQGAAFRPFIPQNGNVLLPFSAAGTSTNYSTLTASLGNGYTGTNGFFYINSFVQTNSTGYPPNSGFSPVWAQGNPFSDVPLWANRDGTAPLASFNISLTDPNTVAGGSTNIVIVTLTTLNRNPGQYAGAIYNNQGQNQFTFTCTNSLRATNSLGYGSINISTNIPTSFLQGALALQLQLNIGAAGTNAGIAWSNVTGPYNALVTNTVTGWKIVSAGISGWTPDGQ